MKKISLIMLAFFLFIAVSCGENTTKTANDNEKVSDEDAATDDVADQEFEDKEVTDEVVAEEENEVDVNDEDSYTPPILCEDFADGLNKNFLVGKGADALARSFILKLPENIDSKKDWPVIFIWHGYGDTAQNIQSVLSSKVNNSEMPFILVVPEARADLFTFGLPPKGLDWDMINLSDGSAEVDMFDSVVACLDKRWGVNDDHIHLAGFSAGAITADSVALMRHNVIASIFTYSGAYFSNPESREDLGEISGISVGSFFSWPDMDIEHTKYAQVFVSGDEGKDTWSTSGFTIDFNHMANFDADYLTSLGHNVVICNHGGSHTISGPGSSALLGFFKSHPFGTEISPYKDGLPEGFDNCEFRTEPENNDDSDDSDETSDSDSI